MNLYDDIKATEQQKLSLETVYAEIEQLFVHTRVPQIELLSMTNPMDGVKDILIRMSRQIAHIPGKERVVIPRITQQRIIVPATWWDHFKRDHFDVLLRWFPVRYEVIQKAEVLQYEQMYQARWYLPNLEVPERYAGPVELKLFHALTTY